MRAIVYGVLFLSLAFLIGLHITCTPWPGGHSYTDAVEEIWRSQIETLNRQILAAEVAGRPAEEIRALRDRQRPLVKAWEEYQRGQRELSEELLRHLSAN